MAIEAESTTVELPDVNEMSREELEAISSASPEEIAQQLAQDKDTESDGGQPEPTPDVSTPKPKFSLKPTSKPIVDEAIDVDLGNGRKITFKNRDELIHNFSSLRNGLDEINAKHGRTVSELQRLKGIDTQFADLQRQLDEMRRSPAQPSVGQPVAVSAATAQKAEELGIDLSDLTPENFAEKMVLLRKAAALEARKELEPTIAEIRRENKELRDQFGRIERDMTFREQKSVFDSHYLNLMSEVTQLQGKVGSLKTQWTPAQINDAIIQYGPEQARLVVPPGDFEKWETIEAMLKETYCPVDGQGNLDITQRKLKSINGAWAAYAADHPELNDQTIVAAHANGQQSVLDQVKRVASRPPTLPNNLATPDTDPGSMTFEDAQKWINTPADQLQIWKRTKDPRYKKFEDAQAFVDGMQG
jgi:hypothetical protein